MTWSVTTFLYFSKVIKKTVNITGFSLQILQKNPAESCSVYNLCTINHPTTLHNEIQFPNAALRQSCHLSTPSYHTVSKLSVNPGIH